MRLVITEKPSVAKDLARVLGARSHAQGWHQGEGLRITWCLGHLVELEEPHHYRAEWRNWSLEALPMIPTSFALRVRKDAQERFQVVSKLLRDPSISEVVNACDAGREGELIFRYVYELAGGRAPVRRLWLASLTETAIREAWGRLRPAERLDPLADAARCRSEADWLVGINATRAMTCLARKAGGGRVLPIGRVQTPTLAMIVARDHEIEAFVSEPFWQVKATFQVQEGGRTWSWQGTWFRSDSSDRAQELSKGRPSSDREAPVAERLASAELAAQLAKAVQGRPGQLERSETRRVVDKPPLLYDLTSLQRRANQRYGLSADRTLEIAQALYERHKLITYPRTDARFLTPDQVPELPVLARGLHEMPPYAEHADHVLERWAGGARPGRRVINAKEVGDHHAILPTGRPAHRMGLSLDEKRVFDLVARRFLAALSDDALFDRTTLVVAVDAPPVEGIEPPPRFRAKGRVCIQQGWRAVDPPGRSKELELPRLAPDQPVQTIQSEVSEGATRPRRPHDDASILKAMETAGRDLDDAALERALRGSGLGTPATRASILKALVQRGFVQRRGKELRATERGRALIAAVPADELKSAQLTGEWERRLGAMERGEESRQRFMADVVAHVHQLVSDIAAAEAPTGPAFAAPVEGKPVGSCRACGSAVAERPKVYACTGCEFVVFKTMSGRAVSRRMVAELLGQGQTRIYKGFRSRRTGKDFEAGLTIRGDGRVGLRFADAPSEPPPGDRGLAPLQPHPSDQGSSPVQAPPIAPEGSGPEGLACPRCGEGRILRGRQAWGCSRYAEGCSYRLGFDEVRDARDAVNRLHRARQDSRVSNGTPSDPSR